MSASEQVEPKFSHALLKEMIQEEEEHIRNLDYLVTRHRTRLAWLRAVQRGTIKP